MGSASHIQNSVQMKAIRPLLALVAVAAASTTFATADAPAPTATPSAPAVSRPDYEAIMLPGGRTVVVAAFRTYVASGYTPSAKNIEFLASLKDKVTAPKLIAFDTTQNNKSVLFCRASFPVYGPNKTPFASLMEAAVNLELVSSGLVPAEAPRITATLDEFDFSSFGGGKWTIDATLRPEGQAAFTVKNVHTYPVSATAVNGCGDVMKALPDGIEAFLMKLYNDPAFISAMR